MEWLDILHRVEAGEDLRTELKGGLDLSAIGKAICAFANTEGGVVILGVCRIGRTGAGDGELGCCGGGIITWRTSQTEIGMAADMR